MPRRGLGTLALATAGLVVPGVLLIVWCVVGLGGQVESLRRDEVADARGVLAELQRRWRRDVETLDEGAGHLPATALRLAGSEIVGPFAAAPEPRPPAAEPIERELASRLADHGRHGEAIPFLRRLEERAGLTAADAVLLARCLVLSGDRAGAEAVLAELEERGGDERPLPPALLAALVRIELAPPAARGARTAALVAALCRHRFALTAGAAEVVAAALRPDRADLALRSWAAAARVQRACESGALRPPRSPRALPGGDLVVPAGDRLLVIAAEVVGARLAVLRTELAASRPQWRLSAAPAAGALAIAAVDPGGGVVHAVPAGELPSAALARLAVRLGWLAAVAFVVGNLVVLRLIRRELAVSRAKSEFVDAVSHELRTPLTALSLKAEMLATGDVPAAKREAYAQGLHRAARRLAGSVERVLDFSRLDRGRAVLSPQRLPARALLAAGLREGRDALRLVGQRLAVSVPRALPSVRVDREVVVRALRNLLDNAAKFAPPASTVHVTAAVAGRRLRICVADEGPGVPLADRAAVFEPFRRGGRAEAAPGTGLGLAMVRQAARLHGGRVSVGERAGGGAAFTLELPVAPEPPGRK